MNQAIVVYMCAWQQKNPQSLAIVSCSVTVICICSGPEKTVQKATVKKITDQKVKNSTDWWAPEENFYILQF
jgi:hypothetical protein